MPGCWSEGATEAEAIDNIRDAIAEYQAAGAATLVGTDVREVEVADYPRLGKRMLRLGQNVEIYDTSDARAFGPLQDETDTSDQP